MSRTKYKSQLNKNDYTFHPGRSFQLDYDALTEIYTDGDENKCYLVPLDGKQIAYLLALTSVFPLYHWIWGLPSPRRNWDLTTITKWDEIQNFYSEVNDLLMSACNLQAFIDAQLLTANNTQNVADNLATINVTLGDIKTTLDQIKTSVDNVQFPTEEIDDLEEILDGIGTILGAAAILGI